MENIELKRSNVEYKAVKQDGNLYITFYGLVYGNVDSYNDVILKGAVDNFLLSPDAKRVKLCFQHDMDDVVGVIEEMTSDDIGLLVKAKILPTSLGNDVAILIEGGALNEASIGYKTIESEMQDDKRLLKEIYLYEISIVSRAANDRAVVIGQERKSEKITKVEDMTDEEMIKLKNEITEEYNKRIVTKILVK